MKIRQSIKDKNRSDLPATFQYTNAGNAKDSKAFDAAVALDLLSTPLGIQRWVDASKHELLFTGEYHYNSAKDAKQDTELLGLSGDFYLGKAAGLDHRLTVEAGYKADRRLTGEGFQGEISYYPYSRGLALWSERQGCIGNYQFEYEFRPEIGVEYEKGDGELKPFREGDRQSFKASMGVALYPWKNLEWTTSVNYWRHFGAEGVYNLFHDDQVYFQSSMIYYLNEGRNFGVGVDYLHGDHPTEGKYDVDAWQFGVRMKF